jgi:thymidylate synthase (FAD)
MKNRQNSLDDMSDADKEWFKETQGLVQEQCERLYNHALRRGIAKEQARFLLPASTRTKIYMKGSLRSWIHYVMVRADKATQKEHRDIAVAIKNELASRFPSISNFKDDK